MTGKTHQVAGLTLSMGYFLINNTPSYNPATFGAVLAVSSIAALLPDIDQPAGKVWHLMPFGDQVGKAANTFLEHRNITHSILGFGLISYGFYRLLSLAPSYWGINTHYVLVAFMLAYGVHLLADMFTVQGIPLLFPFQETYGIPPKPFDGIRILTGKWFENLVIFPTINILLLILIITYWGSIKNILLK